MRSELVGCITEVIRSFPNGGAVLRVEQEDGKQVQLIGQTDNQEEVGLTYRFGISGKTEYNGQERLKFRTFSPHTPNTKKGIIHYLAKLGKGLGIGPANSQKLYDHFGERVLDCLREDKYNVLTVLNRMTEKAAVEFHERLESRVATEMTAIELGEFFKEHQIPDRFVDPAIKKWGTKAVRMILHNPYLLLGFYGFGFKMADALYLRLGHPPGRIKRQTLAMYFYLHQTRDGSIWHRAIDIANVHPTLIGAEANTVKAMKLGIRAGLFEAHRTGPTDSDVYIALGAFARAEKRLAKHLTQMHNSKPSWPHPDLLPALSPHQLEQYTIASQTNLCVLTGGPGTGKTYTAAQIIKAASNKYGSASVALCAPTGKAALRLEEVLREYGLDTKVSTIHSLLGVESLVGGQFSFKHKASNTLPHKFVFIDEASMPDLMLMDSLFKAISSRTSVMLIGDIGQLPPVAPGAPLRDIIKSGAFAVGRLTETRRNSGAIVRVCNQIRTGEPVEFSREIDLENGENCLFIDISDPEQCVNKLLEGINVSKVRGYDILNSVTPIVPTNEKGQVSRKKINLILQEVMNRDGFRVEGCPFRLGDKVVRTKNIRTWVVDEHGKKFEGYVANGDLGVVTGLNEKQISFTVYKPQRTVTVGLQYATEGWDLGYALSCHKAQGSEWDIVFVMVDKSGAGMRVSTREWLYTAPSRGKVATFFIGDRKAFEIMRKTTSLDKRKTFLAEMLGNGQQNDNSKMPIRYAQETQEGGKEPGDQSQRSVHPYARL